MNYLSLLVILLLAGLVTYVLMQDARAATNRLFSAYLGIGILLAIATVIRTTSVERDLVYAASLPIALLISCSHLALIWLAMALFIPQRFEQPLARWLVGLPYLLAIGYFALEALLGTPSWLAVLQPAGDGTFILAAPAGFTPGLLALVLAPWPALLLLLGIVLRHPEHRAAAGTLLVGMLFSYAAAASQQARELPAINVFGPLPLYLAFSWVALRYQLFRPSVHVLQTAIEHLPDGVLILDAQECVRYANRSAQRLLGLGADSTPRPLAAALSAAGFAAYDHSHEASDGRAYLARAGAEPVYLETTDAQVQGERVAARVRVLRDITNAELQALALRAQNREQQRLLDLVDTLETPAIALAEGVLLAPVVGALDARRAHTLTSRLLQDVSAQHVRQVVLDIAGVSAVDAQTAQALLQTTEALRLLGCEVVITGISAGVARTLTHLDVPLAGVATARSPQEALQNLMVRHQKSFV